MRAQVLVATLVLFAVAPAGHAGPAASTCRLVRDAIGDVQPDITERFRQGPPSRALDIIGGDIAADTRSITTVIRLAGSVGGDQYSPTGYAYSFRFTIDAGDTPQTFEMNADIGPASQNYNILRYNEQAGFSGLAPHIRGRVDNSSHEIRMTADMSQVQALAEGALRHPEGHRLHDFEILSGTSTGEQTVAYLSSKGEDIANGSQGTKIGASSCVRHG